MDAVKEIEKILAAKSYGAVVDLTKAKDSHKAIIIAIHPDKCSHPQASEATARLNQLKDEHENGKVYHDQGGKYRSNGFWIMRKEEESDKAMVSKSLQNITRMRQIFRAKSESQQTFDKYVVTRSGAKLIGDDLSCLLTEKRAIPISDINKLDQVHVNWVLSRMLEFIMLINNAGKGYVHCGLSPDTVFIVPETHGIVVVSAYNLTQIDQKVTTIDGNYKHWYPRQLFDYKTAVSMIDIEMAKRTACWLLGDKSGMGISLRGKVNPEFLNFVLGANRNPYTCLTKYREMLAKNFESKFHILDI